MLHENRRCVRWGGSSTVRQQEASQRPAGRECWKPVSPGSVLLLGYDVRLSLDQSPSLPLLQPMNPKPQPAQGLRGGDRGALGKDWAGAPLPSRGRPPVTAPLLQIGMLLLGLVQAFWPWVREGEPTFPSPRGSLAKFVLPG